MSGPGSVVHPKGLPKPGPSIYTHCPMFGLTPKLPVNDQERVWVNLGFQRLERMLGRDRMVNSQVILPTPAFFPDPYDETAQALDSMFARVCDYMKVNRGGIDLEILSDETGELRKLLPQWRARDHGAAGLYVPPPEDVAELESGQAVDVEITTKTVVCVHASQLKNPLALVATLAHELGHVILLGGGLMKRDVPDMEPMTDLLTVFLGLGIFRANSAFQFKQWQDDRRQGWSIQRQSYLSEEIYGYALARYAVERGEDKPDWIKFLSTNLRSYYKRSRGWLAKNRGDTPIG
jgi:hypothetical protein